MLGTVTAYVRSHQMDDENVVAVGLLTRRDIRVLGPTFRRLWPVEETPCFSQLLQAIDEADRDFRLVEDASRES